MKSNPINSLWQLSWPLLIVWVIVKKNLYCQECLHFLKKKKTQKTSEKNQWHAVIDIYSSLQKQLFGYVIMTTDSHAPLPLSSQVCSLRLWSRQWTIADEGQLRQATQRQPVAQRGGVPGRQQRTYAQDRLTHRYSALQWSTQPGPQR